MIFQDRKAAGQLLADKLRKYQGKGAVVLGLPKGGLFVARPIADALGLPLDLVVARKIGAPGNAEFAIGAVTARGSRVLNERVLCQMILPPGFLEEALEREQRAAEAREAKIRGDRPSIALSGKTVILVDDGIATGMTVRAAIADLRECRPRSIVVAVPVVAPSTFEELQEVAEEVVALHLPDTMHAVGLFYRHFPPLTDEAAAALL
ncbi:MAG: phosphoribosyltransferase [Bacteroidota bacterium]